MALSPTQSDPINMHGNKIVFRLSPAWDQPNIIMLPLAPRPQQLLLQLHAPGWAMHANKIVRRLPRNKTELLAIWGMSEKRYNSHGALMLQALAPLRQELQVAATERRQRILENSAATSSSKDPTDMASKHRCLR